MCVCVCVQMRPVVGGRRRGPVVRRALVRSYTRTHARVRALQVLKGEPHARRECPCCRGVGKVGGLDGVAPPMVGNKGKVAELGLDLSWFFFSAASLLFEKACCWLLTAEKPTRGRSSHVWRSGR